MGEINVPFVRGHIGALGHVAEIAERAGIHDRLEISRLHFIEFAGRRRIDQIEQARETVAEIEAAPAAMADIEDAPQFGVDLLHVVEIGRLPIQRMAGRRFKAAFAHIFSSGGTSGGATGDAPGQDPGAPLHAKRPHSA